MAYLSIRAGSSSLARKQAMKKLGKAHVVSKVKWNPKAPPVRGKRLYSVRIHFRVKRPRRRRFVMPKVPTGRMVRRKKPRSIASQVRSDLTRIEKDIRKVLA